MSNRRRNGWAWAATLSLSLNLALGGWLGFRPSTSPASAPATTRRDRPTSMPARTAVPSEPADRTITNTLRFQWAWLESEDYATYVANLRSICCPEPLIRALIAEELEALYDRRRGQPIRGASFWTHGEEWAALSRRHATERGSLKDERNRVYRELVGVDFPESELDEPEAQALLTVVADFLPEDRREAAINLLKRIEDRADAIRAEADYILLPADRQRLLDEYDAWHGELQALLGPAGLGEARLRLGLVKNGDDWLELFKGVPLSGPELRRCLELGLGDYDLFRNLFLRDNDLADLAPPEPDPEEDAAVLAGAAQFLGGERGQTLLRNQDPRFRELRDFGESKQLPAATVAALYGTVQATKALVDEVRTDAALSAEERQERLAETVAALELAVRQRLDGALAEEYLRQSAHWMTAWQSLPEGGTR